jgi:pimeloyl-ACP methyl ester carboxylesterase
MPASILLPHGALAFATVLLNRPPDHAQPATLAWHACPADTVYGTWPRLGSRLQCATLAVPRDPARPGGETVDLLIVRVRAVDQATPGSALLVEDSVLAPPVTYALPRAAMHWATLSETAWRDVAARRVLVGVSHRQLADAPRDCLAASATLPAHAALGVDASSANVLRAENRALAVAAACANDPMASHVGAAVRIADLEQVRRVLGGAPWHMYATGDAAWMAARYAERHPGSIARLLIDGGVDFDAARSEIIEAPVAGRGRRLRRLVQTAVSDPVRYELGTDEAALWHAISMLPRLPAETWLPAVASVEALKAILVVGAHLEATDWHDTETLLRRVETLRYSPYPERDGAIRDAARQVVVAQGIHAGVDPFGVHALTAGPGRVAARLAALCNDDASLHGDNAWWRQRTDDLRARWPGAVGNETFAGLVCAHWPRAWAAEWHVPDTSSQPPMLMVHAEYDVDAPLHGAVASFHPRQNISLVVARGIDGHRVADREDLPCVARAASRYLLDGTLPADRLTNCPPLEIR